MLQIAHIAGERAENSDTNEVTNIVISWTKWLTNVSHLWDVISVGLKSLSLKAKLVILRMNVPI